MKQSVSINSNMRELLLSDLLDVAGGVDLPATPPSINTDEYISAGLITAIVAALEIGPPLPIYSYTTS